MTHETAIEVSIEVIVMMRLWPVKVVFAPLVIAIDSINIRLLGIFACVS